MAADTIPAGGAGARLDREQGITLVRFPLLESTRLVEAVFTTRTGGVSPPPFASLNIGSTTGDDPDNLEENRRRLRSLISCDSKEQIELVHGVAVWEVDRSLVIDHPQLQPVALPMGAEKPEVEDDEEADDWKAPPQAILGFEQPLVEAMIGTTGRPQVDAMTTATIGRHLVVTCADCLAVYVLDPETPAIGLAHAGWRGTVLGAGVSALRTLTDAFGTRPQDVQAAIGPSIGPQRYQVGEEVVAAVAEAFGGTDGLVQRADDGSAYLDLWAANELALQRAGVTQIEVAGLCTATRTDEFYSHRAERGRTGRFGVIAALQGS